MGCIACCEPPDRYTKFVGSFGELKCTVQLQLSFADGSSAEILSDGSWKTAPGPITFSSTYGGEDFDARLEPQGWDRAGFDDERVARSFGGAGPGGALTPEIAPPIRVMHVYAPVKVTHPKPGVTVYDLGQNFAGWPEITVNGQAGSRVKLIAGELLDKDGLGVAAKLRAARSGIRTRCAAAELRRGIRGSVITDSAMCRWRAARPARRSLSFAS